MTEGRCVPFAAEAIREHLPRPTVIVAPSVEWIEQNAKPTDVIVVPGGRNGALTTARTTKQATMKGCSIMVAADRESVSASDRAAQGLGLVTA
jgi:hypothetical protein